MAGEGSVKVRKEGDELIVTIPIDEIKDVDDEKKAKEKPLGCGCRDVIEAVGNFFH